MSWPVILLIAVLALVALRVADEPRFPESDAPAVRASTGRRLLRRWTSRRPSLRRCLELQKPARSRELTYHQAMSRQGRRS